MEQTRILLTSSESYLIAATRKGQRDVVAVHVLLQHGAVDTSQSPLQEAIEKGHTGITTMLMKAIAEVSHLGIGGERWGVNKGREKEEYIGGGIEGKEEEK